LLTEGIDVRTVANRLGHARTSTTMDIYWGFVPTRERDAADHLETILRPVDPPGTSSHVDRTVHTAAQPLHVCQRGGPPDEEEAGFSIARGARL
jgi:hypothetical protein